MKSAWAIGWTALVLTAGCQNPDGNPWLIGHVADLRSPAGVSARRGVQMAVERANADEKNRIGGRRVAVIHADSRGRAGDDVGQLMRLAAVNKIVAGLGGTTFADMRRIAPELRTYAIIWIGAGGDTGDPPAPELFAFGVPPAERVKQIAAHLADREGRWVVAAPADEPSTPVLVSALRDARPGRPVGTVDPGRGGGWATAIAEWKSSPPAAVLLSGPAAVVAVGLRQIAAAQLPSRIVFAGDETELDELAAARFDGLLAVTDRAADDTEALREFRAAYREKFGTDADRPAEVWYDAARLLFDAARAARSFESRKLRKQLEQTRDWPSLAGAVTVGETNHRIPSPARLVELRDGAWSAVAAPAGR